MFPQLHLHSVKLDIETAPLLQAARTVVPHELDSRFAGKFGRLYNLGGHPFARRNERAPYLTCLLKNIEIGTVIVEVGAGESFFSTLLRLQGIDVPERGKLRLVDLRPAVPVLWFSGK